MSILSKIYNHLPIVRELKFMNSQTYDINKKLDRLNELTKLNEKRIEIIDKTIKDIQICNIKKSLSDYSDEKKLLRFGAQYWSQNYEDGMIAEIFQRIGTDQKNFVEIGVQDGKETNTSLLVAMGWKGWWFEADPNFVNLIRKNLMELNFVSRLTITQAMVSTNNVNQLFKDAKIPSQVDLFSLDIDIDTYHIWAALQNFQPRVVVIEYNAGFPPDQIWVHPSGSCKTWNGTMEFGASLKALEKLGIDLGYSLVGCDLLGVNAFFVRNDLVGEKFSKPFTAENHYQPPRYHLLNRNGHESFFPYPNI